MASAPRQRLAVLATLLLALAPPLAAQDLSGLKDPINPDRPDFTNGPLLVAPGHLQVETGYTYGRQGDTTTQTLGEILLRYAWSDVWEARLGLGSYEWLAAAAAAPRASGFQDPFVEVKLRLNDPEAAHRPPGAPALGLLLTTTVPVGGRALTADVWQPRATLALHWDLPAGWSLESNLGAARLADGGERFTQAFGSLSAGFTINPRWGGFLEGYVLSQESADGAATRYADAGISYQVSNDLALDVRLGAGLAKPHPNWLTGLGAAIRF